jgi:nucleoid DNA-binding protein
MATKAVLARNVRKSTGLSYKLAAQCVDITLDTLADGIACGETFVIQGFGTFECKIMPEKECRTLISENKNIPAHGRVRFRPCEKLRKAVWGLKHKEDK